MTIEERIAAAIAASRTGTTAGWQAYSAEALRLIARYGEIVAPHANEPAAPGLKKP